MFVTAVCNDDSMPRDTHPSTRLRRSIELAEDRCITGTTRLIERDIMAALVDFDAAHKALAEVVLILKSLLADQGASRASVIRALRQESARIEAHRPRH